MRRLLLAFCCLVSIVAQAQFKTMLKPGRAWQMSHHTLNLFHEEEGTEYHTTKSYMLFVGETFVDSHGRTCFIIIYGDERSDIPPYSIACVYEDNGKLYELSDDCAMPPSPRLVLNFTPSMGDKYPYYNGNYSSNEYISYRDVNKVDSIMVNGELCKRIHLGGTGYENEDTYLVEGIGISNDNLLWYRTSYEALPNGIVEWNTLDAVYDEGTCIFRASDFSKPAYNEQADSIPKADVASVWTEGSEWQVFCEEEADAEGPASEIIVRYRLGLAENGYMALEKTESINGVKGTPEVIGYVRNEDDAVIYVRPVLEDGSIGAECVLYDFSTPFEYGNTIRYGVEGGEMKEEYIDWQKDSLDYYMISGDSHVLPAWGGIIYGYGYIGGPMELFQRRCAPGKTTKPKATNISHVIFSTKGGEKAARKASPESQDEIFIPYKDMLTDGTKWECMAVSKESSEAARTYTIELKGDTLIGNRKCKQVYFSDGNVHKIIFEEGRKLYMVNADNVPEVVLDFGMKKGDALDEVAYVLDVSTMQNQGHSYRTSTIETGLECNSYFVGDTEPWLYTLIEGIGVSKDEHLGTHRVLGDDSISYLLRCWKDGALVYQSPFYEMVTGIRQTTTESGIAIYDLQGHRLKNRLQKGIVIIDKKKIIRR